MPFSVITTKIFYFFISIDYNIFIMYNYYNTLNWEILYFMY